MELTTYAENFKPARLSYFKWSRDIALTQKLLLALGFALVTGLLAQVKFYLPISPVPITGQTFAVFFSAILLGRSWGGISQILYVTLGIAGVPWFANWTGGIAALAGPTGGYIIGFIIAAFFLGYFVDKYVKSRKFINMLALMLFANFILVYAPGLLQLNLWLSLIKGQSIGFMELLGMGAIPFVIGDIFKIALSAIIAGGITPKEGFNKEADG